MEPKPLKEPKGLKRIFKRGWRRSIPKGRCIVSPADGRVIKVMEVDRDNIKIDKGLFGKIYTLSSDIGKQCYLVSIFMNPFNVHLNRSPLAGKIVSIRHKSGTFFPTNSFKLGLENEKNEVIIKTKIGKVKVIQIAGLIAKRIRCAISEGSLVRKGQVIGSISFGSQVVFILPKRGVTLCVKEGKKVKGGVSVIGRY